MEIESTATLYALSIKGGYYDGSGEIVEQLVDAQLFSAQREAIAFRKAHDPRHRIEQSTLLQLTVFISESD